ncbi:MAG: hypothetical protein DI536_19730 [Archangium gephyra]|uniref:Uncharacterized protein n=1 Tax=Archangium gephyra TaxID=48 RepID=A0A2W5T9A1_9BACT|nr:MAG: hypothetical protein DI536_19730 [Archangium gephyra]
MTRLAGLLVVLLPVAALAEDPKTPPPIDQRAACLKTCAGEPKNASGEKLMACLKQCEAPQPTK